MGNAVGFGSREQLLCSRGGSRGWSGEWDGIAAWGLLPQR